MKLHEIVIFRIPGTWNKGLKFQSMRLWKCCERPALVFHSQKIKIVYPVKMMDETSEDIKRLDYFLNFLEDTCPFCGATDTPVLDQTVT